jgi:hypothetical protein
MGFPMWVMMPAALSAAPLLDLGGKMGSLGNRFMGIPG